jgi:hypothetical protein
LFEWEFHVVEASNELATGPGLIANHIADKASKVVATDFSRGKTIFAMILGEIRKC